MRPTLKSAGLAILLGCSTAIALCSPAMTGRSPVMSQSTTAQPAFKVGDFVENNNLGWIAKVERIEGDRYCVKYAGSLVECITADRIRAISPHLLEAKQLHYQCNAQLRKSDITSAPQICQQALDLYRKNKSFQDEDDLLEILITFSSFRDDYPKVIEYAQMKLEGARKLQDTVQIYVAYEILLRAYQKLGNYAKTVETIKQILVGNEGKPLRYQLYKAIGSLENVDNNLGDQTAAKEIKQLILKTYQSELSRAQIQRDSKAEMDALRDFGDFFRYFQEFSKSIEYFEQGLEVARKSKDLTRQWDFLNSLRDIYPAQGNTAKTVEAYNQLLQVELVVRSFPKGSEQAIKRERETKLEILYCLIGIYEEKGDKNKVKKHIEQASKIHLELNSPSSELFYQLYFVYSYLGNKYSCNCAKVKQDLSKAVRYYEQALDFWQKGKYQNTFTPPELLINLGASYRSLKNYSKALEHYQKALDIAIKGAEPANIAWTFQQLAETSIESGNYAKAIEYSQKQLAITKQLRVNISGTAQSAYPVQRDALRNIALAHQKAGNIGRALETYQTLLALAQEKQDRDGQVSALNSIAELLIEQNKPELAITFYKQSVNTIEITRQELRQLQRRTQEAYMRKVESTYRRLADLLLSQGRIGEAEQVLELLRIQEIRNYTKDSRAGEQVQEASTIPIESQVLKTHGTLIAFGLKLDDCATTQCAQLNQLLEQRQVLDEDFNRVVKQLEQTVRRNRGNDAGFTDPEKLFGNPDQVVSHGKTVLVQTLVLENRLWVLWAAKGGITKSISVPVNQKQLSETVVKFRRLLQDPTSNLRELKATSQQLYDWLIPASLQTELQKNSIQNLVFAPDHVTRYIPMTTLFDGKQYLAERYTHSTIISTSTEISATSLTVQGSSVLALGLSEAKAGFTPLPNVPLELAAIVQRSPADKQGIYPGDKYLNQLFTWSTLRENLSGGKHNILHVATHGKFNPGDGNASFLVMGDGEKLPTSKIKTLRNLKLQLVVLSACETALGATGQDGTEISGISSYFLNNGAKTVIASLWLVNDASTSVLMQQFYKNLANGKLTKAEALQQAQLGLLQGKVTAKDAQRRSSEADIRVTVAPVTRASRSSNYAHPYYWAPFILIGNSL